MSSPLRLFLRYSGFPYTFSVFPLFSSGCDPADHCFRYRTLAPQGVGSLVLQNILFNIGCVEILGVELVNMTVSRKRSQQELTFVLELRKIERYFFKDQSSNPVDFLS